ncbi:MAG: transketolase [Paenibacillaceae bacterium ZCTH02-B3]|nr:MAG: transketolase [Paenibacillaceae bacterium ZCTH02-B3]
MTAVLNQPKKIATRDAFGDEIVELGLRNQNIYVIDVDIGKSCKTTAFAKRLPDQHINVGIAEQNGAGIAAGLATTGKIPFVCTYAVFGSLRMAEQIRQSICYPYLNVKIACSHGGLTPGNDGGSHQAVEDMGVMRTIPNMTVIMGADYFAARKLTALAAETYGPVYLRFTRDPVPVIYDESAEFEIGKAKKLREGKDLAIIANGDTVHLALKAADELQKQGVSVKLFDMHTLKPLDREAVLECLDTGRIITVEDHNILNGLGSAVCEVVAEEGRGIVRRIGIQDRFGESAPYEKLLEINGITVENIVNTARQLLERR